MNADSPSSVSLDAPELEDQAVAFFQTVERAAAGHSPRVEATYGSATFTLTLPPLGEGDRGMVYTVESHSLAIPAGLGPLCLKVAKPQPICRERLLEEMMTTGYFLAEGVVVPRIHYMDPLGRFAVKDRIEGESITSIYLRFAQLTARAQELILGDLENFLNRLLDLFRKRPDCQVSISPNNIYVLSEGGRFHDPVRFVLIDPGTTLKKNYDGFTFNHYWNKVLPDRIRKYERTGYLQWLVPREVNESERDEVKSFEIFRGMTPGEVFILLKAARTVEFDAEQTILRQGEVGENFFLVLEGVVEARRSSFVRTGSWNVRVGRGSVVGEMAFLLHVPRSMTAVATTRCKLIEIDRGRFNEMLDAKLTAPYKLIHNIAIMLAERLHARDRAHQELLEAPKRGGS
jgi:CRP/FNR family transcriptional regulator, cyclic AMP receptor protein